MTEPTPPPRSRITDPGRLAALEETRLLDSFPEESFDRITRLAADVLGTPLALVNLVDDRRQYAKSCFAPPGWSAEREAPLADSFCQWAVLEAAPVLIEDARRDARVSASRLVTETGVLAYLGVPLTTSEGWVLGTLCVADLRPRGWSERDVRLLTDIAAAVGSEIELRREIRRRAEAEKLKSDIVSVVSHELRTPLTSIYGSLRLVGSGKLGDLSPQGERMIQIASQNSERLVRLINNILDLEKLESGRLELSAQPVSAAHLARTAIDAVHGVAEGAGIEVEMRVEEDFAVHADEDRVVQVLVNLLSNAVKFSPVRGRVQVVAEARGREGFFQVRDRGRGIPDDQLDSIFEPFHQVDRSDAREKGGSGLGLAITREIVRQHGGKLWVASELGRGSTFFFTLPAA